MAARRFPPAWTVEEQPACFIVRDHDGPKARLHLFRGRAGAAKLLTRDEAHRQAAGGCCGSRVFCEKGPRAGSPMSPRSQALPKGRKSVAVFKLNI
jgi:hypothetical protein